MQYTMANMDALQNWFFWTWKIGNSTQTGYPTSPMWHYKLGVDNGWMPQDPRVAGGFCKGIGVGGNQVSYSRLMASENELRSLQRCSLLELTQYQLQEVFQLQLHPPIHPLLLHGHQRHWDQVLLLLK